MSFLFHIHTYLINYVLWIMFNGPALPRSVRICISTPGKVNPPPAKDVNVQAGLLGDFRKPQWLKKICFEGQESNYISDLLSKEV